MIYKLTGKLIHKEGGRIAVELPGGISFEVSLPLTAYAKVGNLGDTVSLFTHFVLREDGAFLYGFTALEEKALFLKLLSVSKIGPKSALNILGNIGSKELVSAIAGGDAARLSGVPGVGRKTAERILLELRDKLAELEALPTLPKSVKDDVESALVNMGYKQAEAKKALKDLDDADFTELFKKALRTI